MNEPKNYGELMAKINRMTEQGKYIEDNYKNLILAEFNEIGFAFVGKRKYVCADDPQQERKRFAIHYGSMTFSLILWQGTSNHARCDDHSPIDPIDRDYHFIQEIKSHKYIDFLVSFIDEAQNIQLLVFDEFDCLTLPDNTLIQNFQRIEDLMIRLKGIRQTCAQCI